MSQSTSYSSSSSSSVAASPELQPLVSYYTSEEAVPSIVSTHAMDMETQCQPAKFTVGVSIGSSSVQGWSLKPNGQLELLFEPDDELAPKNVSIKTLVANKEQVRHLFTYLTSKMTPGTRALMFNSVGYAIDGDKKLGRDVGPPFAFVEDLDKFKHATLMEIMASVVDENPEFRNRFGVVNRHCKTEHGEEIGGQWAKQLLNHIAYLEEKQDSGIHDSIRWVCDLGGKSGTIYELDEEKGLFVKMSRVGNIMKEKGSTPNELIEEPDRFTETLNAELAGLQDEGIDLTQLAILQTGNARKKNIQGIFSDHVAYHDYLSQEDEAYYEALDFVESVLRAENPTGFSMLYLTDTKNRLRIMAHTLNDEDENVVDENNNVFEETGDDMGRIQQLVNFIVSFFV